MPCIWQDFCTCVEKSLPWIRMVSSHKARKEGEEHSERVSHLVRKVQCPQQVEGQERTSDHVVTILLK
jgi:hypothetical protein